MRGISRSRIVEPGLEGVTDEGDDTRVSVLCVEPCVELYHEASMKCGSRGAGENLDVIFIWRITDRAIRMGSLFSPFYYHP